MSPATTKAGRLKRGGSEKTVPARVKHSRKAKSRRVAGAARIRARDLPAFTRALSSMLSAGFPIDQALSTVEAQTDTPAFQEVIRGVEQSIRQGNSLTHSMAQFPSIFEPVYQHLLQVGEDSGKLSEALDRLADYLEASADLRRQVRSAAVYPVVVGGVALILLTAIMIWIIPAFEDIYEGLGGVLPSPTRLLITISHLVRDNVLIVIGVAVISTHALRMWKRTASGAHALDRLLLSLPVIGALRLQVVLGRFAETLASTVQSGLPILRALDLAGSASGSASVERIVAEARQRVQGGDQLGATLAQYDLFPAMLIKYLTVGEQTGKIDEMLSRVASFYRREVEATLKGFTSAIEPLLIVMLGLLIGGVVVCMFLPIFRMHELVSM